MYRAAWECDAHENYKKAYMNAKKEDIVIVKSPVGMPDTAPYCITEALVNAVEGRIDEGLIFCGSNACRLDRMETVQSIMEEFA